MAQASQTAARPAGRRHFGALSLTEYRRQRLVQIWQQARIPQGVVIAFVGASLAIILGVVGRLRCHLLRLASRGRCLHLAAIALTALLDASSADAVFIERNVEDPHRGLCSSLDREFIRSGIEHDTEGTWDLVPWSWCGDARKKLEAGIPDALHEEVFQPYARAHEAGTQPASVGLGLSVARDLARLMGGDVVHGRRDGWTRFELLLPLADSTTPAARAAAS